MDLDSIIQERNQRLEELRKRHEQTNVQDLNSFSESNVESLVEHILKSSSNIVSNNENNTITPTENNVVVTESDNSYSESRVPNENEKNITIERYEKSVQTTFVRDIESKEKQSIQQTNNVSQPSSRIVANPQQPVQPINQITSDRKSITSIKKKIRIIDNREGLQKINENMKNKSVTASIGIVERALNQMEEYDFLHEYISYNNDSIANKENFSLNKQYSFDILRNMAVTSISVSPSMKNVILVTYNNDINEGCLALWDLTVPDHPYRLVSLKDGCLCGCFHPDDKTQIIAGLYTGFLAVWNLAEENMIVMNNATKNSHTLPVVNVESIHNTVFAGFLSVSHEGMLCIWNKTSIFDPMISINLNSLMFDQHQLDFPLLPTCISSYNSHTNQFYIGNEDGRLLQLSIHDSIIALEKILIFHSAPITSIATHSRESFSQAIRDSEKLNDLILVGGFDWSISLWSPSFMNYPLLSLTCFSSYIISIQWHPIHPLIFLIITENAQVQVWNLMIDRTSPVYVFTVPNCSGITVGEWIDNGRKILLGCQNGSVLCYDIKSDLIEFREENLPSVYRVIDEMVQEANHI